MPAEPVSIFSCRSDLSVVVAAARAITKDVSVQGPPSDWRRITMTFRYGLLRRPVAVTIINDPTYYVDPNWSRQLRGMTAYIQGFRENPNIPKMMALIASLRTAISIPAETAVNLDDTNDAACLAVLKIARALDGILVTPTTFRDHNGQIIIAADGKHDPSASVPTVPASSIDPQTRNLNIRLPADVAYQMRGPNTEQQLQAHANAPPPPDAARVARRALALAAVAGRGLLEVEDHRDPGIEQTRGRILGWIDAMGIGDELEPSEWQILQQPLGTPQERDGVNATWRLEGLAVLAWALQRQVLPPPDQLSDPGKLLPAIGLLHIDRAKALLVERPLRPRDELTRMQQRLFAIHWRLRKYRLKPEPMNFREFARTAWFGPLDVAELRLVNDDLALGEHSIAEASVENVQTASSAALERHLAVNWLCNPAQSYSETDVST